MHHILSWLHHILSCIGMAYKQYNIAISIFIIIVNLEESNENFETFSNETVKLFTIKSSSILSSSGDGVI